MDSFTFAVEEIVQCVTCWVQTQSIATNWRNLLNPFQMIPPALTSIFRWADNSSNLGNIEYKTGRKRPNFPSRRCKQSIPTFHKREQGPWGEELHILVIPYSNVQNRFEKLDHMFPFKLTKVHQLQPQDYSKHITYSQSSTEIMSSDSGL